jgi:hypothetical protein
VEQPEPVIAYEVRDLLRNLSDEMRKRFEELSLKLDDRVTIGVFNALRSDLDNAIRRLIDAETEIDVMQEAARAEVLAREVARKTLADETERRRRELEKPERVWLIRSNKANVMYAAVAISVVVYGLFRAYLVWRGANG